MESSIPWADLQDQPLMPPPPGRVPNFVHPESRAWEINVATSICLPLIALFASMRFYAKAVVLKKWKWDDVTCVLGLLAGLAYLIFQLIAANSGLVGKHSWELRIGEYSAQNIVLALVLEAIYAPCIWFVKLSLFVLYVQVFHPLRWLRYCAYAGVVITGLSSWAMPIIYLAMCVPRDGTSQEDYFMALLSPRCQNVDPPLQTATGVISMVSDLYLVILPLPAVWNLQMPLHRKAALSAMFFTGVIAFICSAFQLAYRVEIATNPDTTWILVPLGVVTNVEITAGILVCCMPTTTTVLKKLWTPLSSFASSYRSSFRSKSRSGATDQYNLSSVTNLHSTDRGGFHAINGEATHEAFDGNIRKTTAIEVTRPRCNE